MELGEKLLFARQEKGLSQRQLCEGIVTRNMLSLIEHGAARPSMDTLRLLAARLGKPMSWFLEETEVISPNQELMVQAETHRAAGAWSEVWLLLKSFRLPDPPLEGWWHQLSAEAGLAMAEKAMAEGKDLYARQLLEETGQFSGGGLERLRLLMLGRLPDRDSQTIVAGLPSLDEELLLRSEAALEGKNPSRALALLNAAEDHTSSRWKLLQGRALMAEGQFSPAAKILKQLEAGWPEESLPLLEQCYRELGNYKKAYEYACKQR